MSRAKSDWNYRLRSLIDRAFGNADRPHDDDIATPASEHDFERSEIRDFLRGKDWRDVKPNDGQFDYGDVLPLLTDSAFVYYLPAWLLAALDNLEVTTIDDLTLYSLCPKWVEGPMREWFDRRIGKLTLPQQEAVTQFVQYMIDNTDFADDPVVPVMRRYWRIAGDETALGPDSHVGGETTDRS
jgi:hypothetical protein